MTCFYHLIGRPPPLCVCVSCWLPLLFVGEEKRPYLYYPVYTRYQTLGALFNVRPAWQERDMRDRVQKKRALALERARKEEMVLRLHEDRLIRQEVGVFRSTGGCCRVAVVDKLLMLRDGKTVAIERLCCCYCCCAAPFGRRVVSRTLGIKMFQDEPEETKHATAI